MLLCVFWMLFCAHSNSSQTTERHLICIWNSLLWGISGPLTADVLYCTSSQIEGRTGSAGSIIRTFHPTTRRRFSLRGGCFKIKASLTIFLESHACSVSWGFFWVACGGLLFGSLSSAGKVDAPAFSSREHHWCLSARNIWSVKMISTVAFENRMWGLLNARDITILNTAWCLA